MKVLRHFILTLLGLGLFTTAYTQANYEPTILILSPHATSASKKVQKEIADGEKQMLQYKASAAQMSAEDSASVEEMPENIRLMFQKKLEFASRANFYSVIPLMAESFLQYSFYEKFNNLLIYAVNEKSAGELNELAAIADAHKMQYVLNFPKVNSLVERGAKRSTIIVQLYDRSQNKMLIEREYTGDDHNPGFEFGCDEGTLDCTFSNALAQIMSDVNHVVGSNNPTLIREKDLAQERAAVLFTEYYPMEPAREIVEIISQTDSSISTSGFYQGFMDESHTKFIGFFATDQSGKSLSDIKDSKDQRVNIITSDLNDLDNMPAIYAYIALGVQHGSKWHIEKSNVTYFNSDDFETGKRNYFNNLQKWHFFKDGSSEFDPRFWESYFFSQVESAVEKNKDQIEEYTKLRDKSTSEEDREIYQDMVDDFHETDLKNSQYFGLYTIVANDLRKQDAEERKQFELNFGETVLAPFWDRYIADPERKISAYTKLNGTRFAVIYPKDKSIFLCPIVLQYDGERSELHYFVVLDKGKDGYEFYKWDYFKPMKTEYSAMYGVDINEQLNTVTTWNFSFDYLEDRKFWDDHVLKSKGAAYSYLTRIE